MNAGAPANKELLMAQLDMPKALQSLHSGLSFRWTDLSEGVRLVNQQMDPDERVCPLEEEADWSEKCSLMLKALCRHAILGPLRKSRSKKQQTADDAETQEPPPEHEEEGEGDDEEGREEEEADEEEVEEEEEEEEEPDDAYKDMNMEMERMDESEDDEAVLLD